MPSPYYQAGAQRADGVRRLFATVAPRYDLVNDLQSLGLHRHWKNRLVATAQPRPGEIALDLGCGTGDVAFRLARAGAQVLALDFSWPMLERAQRRVQRLFPHGPDAAAGSPASRPRLVMLCGDALRLPLVDASVDLITISYGLRNLADIQSGLREMARVTRPEGRLLILDFGKPSSRCWRAVYFAYLRLCVPLWGWVWCGDPAAYTYILDSLENYPAQEGLPTQLRTAGWAHGRTLNLLGGAMSITRATKGVPGPNFSPREKLG